MKKLFHGKNNSRLIRALNIRLSQLGLARKGYRETTKPELSLVAQFNTKKLGERFGNSLKMDKADAVLALQFSVPLANRTARSDIKITDLEIDQLRNQLNDLTITLSSSLTNIYIQIKGFEKVLELNVEQIDSAREKTKEELRLYEQGRGELTFVIQS